MPTYNCNYDERNLKRNAEIHTYNLLAKPRYQFKNKRHKRLKELQEKLFYTLERFQHRWLGWVSLPYIEFLLTTYCSLRCKHCSNFMQYFGAGGALRFHTTYEQYVRDLDHLLKGLHNLKSLCLTGGEPLMHKDIGRIALYANSKHKVKAIYIVTNTTIVPDEETLTVFGKCHKLKVLFSDYTSNSALLERLKPDELAAALDRHGVRHWKYAAGTVWQDLGDARYRDYSPEEAAALYKACVTSTYCNALFDGKVGACPRGVNITGLGGWIDARDFIDIRANDTPRERRARWVEYFSTDHPSLCQYCNRMHERKIIPVAEQMSHD